VTPLADNETDPLYQRLVLDHVRTPRNQGALPGATHTARGDNPLCGDRVAVSLILDGDRIAGARFEGQGCAIATASASMMTVAVQGQSRADAESVCRRFEAMLSGRADADADAASDLGDLAAFAGVRRYPVRVKCARLPWQTLIAALGGGGSGTVSTE
jgi:nitrogen fixation NifU-like protein